MALLERFERFLDRVIPAPDDVAASVRRGETFLHAGDASGALRIADEALSVAPGFLRALALRVDALTALGLDGEAAEALDVALRDRVLPADLLARRAELAARLGDEGRTLDLEALTRQRLRGRDEGVARRLLAAGRTLLAKGHDTAGLRLVRGATLADPALHEPWLLLGHDALTRGDRGLARKALERGVAGLDPTDANANRLAGEVAWALGERGTAARCLRRAWIAGDDSAIATLVAVLAADDDAASLERVLGNARGELGDVARGLLELARGRGVTPALDALTGPRVPSVLWHYALALALRDAPALAARWCREAPDRSAAAAVLALDAARSDGPFTLTGFQAALTEPTTRPFAREVLRARWATQWGSDLATLLEGLASVVRDAPEAPPSLAEALRARRRELDEPLRVVLLGEFSAGKSTFLNALVGAEVSPMGVLPTTAQVHWLRHGDSGARVLERGGALIETSVDEAPRVVARRRKAGVEVDYVEVTLPVARLARLELIDTPGFNAGDDAHEEAVRRAFDLADVGLWLFDARQAGRHSEASAIDEAAASGLTLVSVLNKIDQAPVAERAALEAYVRGAFGARVPCVASVSAKAALAAVRAGDGRALHESGWERLSRWVDGELLGRRTAWKRARVAWRARGLVEEAQATLAARERARGTKRAAVAALGEVIMTLREALLRAGASLRRDVEVALGDELRGLTDERAEGRDALVADAVAEVGWRARGRALTTLAPQLRELERLGVTVGVVAPEATELLTAPLVQWLDHQVAAGVRAAWGGATGQSFVASDPLALLEAAVDRVGRDVDGPGDALRIALEVACETLQREVAPTVVVPDT